MKTQNLIVAILFLVVISNKGNATHPIINIAKKYLDTPYKAHTLDLEQEEQLIVNQKEVDCTTFVEYVLAEYLTKDTLSFQRALQNVRYRDGVIKGYTSRLHYFSDWVQQAIKNDYLVDVTAKNSTFSSRLDLHYISSHPHSYKSLQQKDSLIKLKEMCEIERNLSGQIFFFLPKEKILEEGLSWIEEGDLIALTTTLDGLDVSHLRFAIYEKNELRLLHASSVQKRVIVDHQSLYNNLVNRGSIKGIQVYRVK